MDIRGLFRKAPLVEPQDLKSTLEGPGGGGVVLLDVREPAEYERGHIPGAVHIPLSRLADRLGELDPSRPVVTY